MLVAVHERGPMAQRLFEGIELGPDLRPHAAHVEPAQQTGGD